MHERVIFLDEEVREVQFQIFEAMGLPINTDATFGTSQLVPVDDDNTLFRIRFVYRTRPFFIAPFAKSRIRSDIEDMTLGMKHYLATGQRIDDATLATAKAALNKQ